MEDFIDPTTTPSNERYNLTSFFREESFGNLIMTGDVYHFMAPNASSTYSSTCYGAANRDLLEALHDSVAIDDSKFDQWSYDGVGNHINSPDGVYDLIVVIWRRSTSYWFDGCSTKPWTGIATLGGTNFTIGDLFVKTIGSPQILSVNGNTVNASPSGVTNYGYGVESTHLIVVHEIAHYLVSSPHPYEDISSVGRSHSFFSSFGTDENTSSFNAYEKDMLGWITPTDISSVTSPYSISLKDAASYGEALKFRVDDDGDEWFYIENR
jgi:M6 family metalloprotease-like protein